MPLPLTGRQRITSQFLRGKIMGLSIPGDGLIGRQVITATGAGVYTPTPGTRKIVVQLQGAGGGGGGVASPGAGAGASAGGGGGGGFVEVLLTDNFSGAAYVVGAGGAAGAAGSNAGTNGADTTFTDTSGAPVTYTAGGGVGGPGTPGGAIPRSCTTAAGGTATNGDLNIAGQRSARSNVVSTTFAIGSDGGGAQLGRGVRSGLITAGNSSVAGSDGYTYGGGGSGAIAVGTGAAAAGGIGANGIIIISEFG